MATFTIPQTTLAVGSRSFGPFNYGTASQVTLTIDRTVAGGLNSLTSASTISFIVDLATTNGGPSIYQFGFTFIGGTYQDWRTPPNTYTSTGQWAKNLPAAGWVTVTMTVAGPSSIVVVGSLVTA